LRRPRTVSAERPATKSAARRRPEHRVAVVPFCVVAVRWPDLFNRILMTQRSGYDDGGRGTSGGGSKSAWDFRSPIRTAGPVLRRVNPPPTLRTAGNSTLPTGVTLEYLKKLAIEFGMDEAE
ncbi:hypothetical protein HK405_007866, partial [Cladochytrium tenue]